MRTRALGLPYTGPTPIDTALDTVRFTRRGASDCRYHGVDARIDEAEIELARAKEINPTGSDLIFEIEGTLQFWCNQFESSQLILNKIRIPNPICSIFMAANDFYLGRKEEARRLIIQIENDFALPVQRVFAGESYRAEEMKAKIAPLFPLREVA